MRSPARVLNSLTKHSQTTEYRFERLYRILFNEEMYYLAYQRIYAKPGNMTQGADGKTIDRMSLSRIEKLIASLKDESYSPQPSRRMYIPKKNGKTRPLGVPSFDDKLVQEVVRMVLEAIYEGHFEDTSHGFRPHRSCHTALNAVQKTFTGKKWFIEGDIKGFFDNVNHDILLENLLPNCKVLNINTPKKQKVPKETNWKQKFQKPQNENICLTYLNTEMNGNFHFLSFCAAFLKVQNQVL